MTTPAWHAPGVAIGRVHVPAQLRWFATGAAIAFLIPFIFSSTLDLHHDLYYLIFFSATAAFLAAYTVSTGLDLRALFTRHWKWSLGIGLVAAGVVVMGVFRQDSTPRPDGWYLWFSALWRGGTYGTVDALLLTAFPVAVAYALHGNRLGTMRRRATFAVLSMALVRPSPRSTTWATNSSARTAWAGPRSATR